MFCVPQKATKKLPERRIRPEDEPAKWEQFIEYNRMDVEAEKEVLIWTLRYPLHKPERELWYIDKYFLLGLNVHLVILDKLLPFGGFVLRPYTPFR